jgi:putative ABC transport system permease protein
MKTESIKYSLRSLKIRKSRSILTIFSIMLGIATIFIFISFGLGLYKYIDTLSSSSSANKVLIEPKGFGGIDTAFSFSEKELKAVEKTSGVYSATGVYFKTAEVEKSNVKKYPEIIGYDPKKPLIMNVFNLGISSGRELQSGDRGVVLGYNYQIADKIFSKPYVLNDNILINGKKVKILGFYKQVGNPADDSQIYVTNDFIKELYSNDTLNYNWLIAEVDISNLNQVTSNIENTLRKERGLDKGKEDFFVQSFDQMIATYSSVLNIVIGFIILIALISILVSAVNTANTMITSVLERTKEIGIMKSIGARNAEIFRIFLFESSFLGFVAGVIGVTLGWLLSVAGGAILKNVGYSFLQPYFSVWTFLGCVAFATLTGAISGVAPAYKAMKTNPVDALRYE